MELILKDKETQEFCTWKLSRVQKALNITTTGSIQATGRLLTDHRGYQRFLKGSLEAILPKVRLLADNHNLELVNIY